MCSYCAQSSHASSKLPRDCRLQGRCDLSVLSTLVTGNTLIQPCETPVAMLDSFHCKTFPMPRKRPLAALVLLCLIASLAARADERVDTDYPHGSRVRVGEFKEKFRSGPCKIEREQKRNGEYKEVRKCKGGRQGYEQKEKYRDGPCLVEREWKANGEYEEKVECKRS